VGGPDVGAFGVKEGQPVEEVLASLEEGVVGDAGSQKKRFSSVSWKGRVKWTGGASPAGALMARAR
jgi:hypothetical protein